MHRAKTATETATEAAPVRRKRRQEARARRSRLAMRRCWTSSTGCMIYGRRVPWRGSVGAARVALRSRRQLTCPAVVFPCVVCSRVCVVRDGKQAPGVWQRNGRALSHTYSLTHTLSHTHTHTHTHTHIHTHTHPLLFKVAAGLKTIMTLVGVRN